MSILAKTEAYKLLTAGTEKTCFAIRNMPALKFSRLIRRRIG